MALWPLIAVALARGDLEEGLMQARALFGPNQQPLPHPLSKLTRSALESSEKNQREAAQTYLAKAVEAARQIGYL
jgi:hypothetical protein